MCLPHDDGSELLIYDPRPGRKVEVVIYRVLLLFCIWVCIVAILALGNMAEKNYESQKTQTLTGK